jgi:cbb3-type cytochrome oxidase cytochrome c subunit
MTRLARKNLLILGGAIILLGANAIIFMPDGQKIFVQERCITCHRFRGQGGMAGPDLTDVSKRRGMIWLTRQIRNSKTHNPDSRMPSYGHLDYIEVLALISYLKT